MKRIDLTGKKLGRFLVTKLAYVKYHKSPISGIAQAKVYWECVCDCGTECVRPSDSLRYNMYPSCGCWNAELRPARTAKSSTKHGLSSDRLYKLVLATKSRAKRTGKEFDLDFNDMVVPDTCPVLGIPLEWGTKRTVDGSPSLDRFDNDKGYTKENVRIISRRANCLKNDATVDELEKIVAYMKGELK